MNKVKLTKRTVDATKANGKRLTIHDTELKGFQCRISSSGSKAYYLYYRTEEGRERRPKIGEHGSVTAEEARIIAKRWLAEIASGKDPSLERQTKRIGETVKEFSNRYMQIHANSKKKASSASEDQRNIDNHIIPRIGNLKVSDITRRDIVRLHQSMKDTPYAANRILSLLSKMFNLAEQWDDRPQGSNPCLRIDKYKEHKRERFLTMDELAKLSEILKENESEGIDLPSIVAALRLLIFTGCRRDEILSLRWEHVDMENASIKLADSKTGKKTVYLTAPAMEVLTNIKKLKNNPYVITGAKQGAHLVNLRKPWVRIRERATIALWKDHPEVSQVIETLKGGNGAIPSIIAIQQACEKAGIPLHCGIMDVRLHDLRHTFASVAVGGGQSLPMIGKLLGHTQPQTTARYAHLADDPIRQAAETIAGDLKAAMDGTHENNIVKFPRSYNNE